jgi:Rrf2 family protein
MLSQKSRYALRALAVLAEYDAPAPLSIQEIATRADAPRKFLEAILLELRKDGIVISVRGKAGGYAMAADPNTIKLSRVIRTLDGPLAPIACASLFFYQPCADCPDPDTCSTRSVMREVRDAVNDVLDGRTIADLTADAAGARKTIRKRSGKVSTRQGR